MNIQKMNKGKVGRPFADVKMARVGVNLRLHPELWSKVQAKCKKLRIPFATWLRQIIAQNAKVD